MPAFDPAPLPPPPARARDVHKNACGRVLVIAGSTGMTGAGAMAARAAFAGGAGVVIWAVPRSLNLAAEMLVVEGMTMPLPETGGGAPSVDAREPLLEAAHEVDAVLLGPGLPATGETGELIRLLIPEIHAPLVLDAGALSAVGAEWAILRKRNAPTVVTPHHAEMARLVNKTPEDVAAKREMFAERYAQTTQAVVLLKGPGTLVADGKRLWQNATGNPALATAGSGDVLAGLLAALVAQRLPVYDATRLAAHLHGLAGDLAVEARGPYGLTAGELSAYLPAAFRRHADGAAGGPA